MAKNLFVFIFTALIASACSVARTVESDLATFVKLDRPIKLADEVYTTDQSFLLMDLDNGQQGVKLGFHRTGILDGGFVYGVTVDKDLCFSRQLLVWDIFHWVVRDSLPPMTKNFCFTVERIVDLR